jgi:hypothetical protein
VILKMLRSRVFKGDMIVLILGISDGRITFG